MLRLLIPGYDAVLFDLDGTLVDTAPDMVAVLQDMQRAHGLEVVPYATARSQVSNGATGLLNVGFPHIEHEFGSPLHVEYLERYEERGTLDSKVFAGVDSLLDTLDEKDVRWGVVTNKPERFTSPLLEALGLLERSACTISGDTLPQRKPHPAPLYLACEQAGVAPKRSIYVGDAARDIEAGQAAGMATIAVGYGYIADDDDPGHWGADQLALDAADLAQRVLKAVTL